LARNPAVKQSLQATYGKRRLDETQRLLKSGREQRVEFYGVVSQSAGDLWLIDGLEVVVGPSTEIFGLIEPGMEIEVRGIVHPQGWVEAESIKIRAFQMEGEVQSIRENRWEVGGLELMLNPISIVDQSLSVGEIALTLVRVEEDGSFTAMVILRRVDPYHDLRLIPSQEQAPGQDASATLKIIEFEGSLQSISGNRWVIGDRQVIVTPASSIHGTFQLGGTVRVKAVVNAEGNLVALEIQRVVENSLDLDEEFGDTSPKGDEGPREDANEDGSSEEPEDEPDEPDDSDRESEEEDEDEDEDEEHEESNKGHVV
jgi:hypothetical protein